MTQPTQELHSQQDASVNWAEPSPDGGIFECRYVRRSPSYVCCYLSSQSYCAQGCKFCHLTATKQTKGVDATVEDLATQAWRVLSYAREQPDADNLQYVNFNFMARGEPLASGFMTAHGYSVLHALATHAQEGFGLYPRFNVSTIMPDGLTKPLHQIFGAYAPTIYYSVYSADSRFRKKWLPHAMPLMSALPKLAVYQHRTQKLVRLHWSFIEGENDTWKSVGDVLNAAREYDLKFKVNVVRYNPPNDKSREADPQRIAELIDYMRSVGADVKPIARVGADVYASCGMFIPPPAKAPRLPVIR